MNDMNDVQEIRRLLDEREVDYDEYSRNNSHLFEIDYCDACGDYLSEIEIFGACIYSTKKYLTPKQAVTVTLESGTLTTEQVKRIHEIIEKHWHDLPAEYDMPEATALPEYSYDWQTIADELNAALGGMTCCIEWRDDSYDTDAGYERDGAYFCTTCNVELPYPLQECWDDYQASHFDKPFNYCPNCGARVKVEE